MITLMFSTARVHVCLHKTTHTKTHQICMHALKGPWIHTARKYTCIHIPNISHTGTDSLYIHAYLKRALDDHTHSIHSRRVCASHGLGSTSDDVSQLQQYMHVYTYMYVCVCVCAPGMGLDVHATRYIPTAAVCACVRYVCLFLCGHVLTKCMSANFVYLYTHGYVYTCMYIRVCMTHIHLLFCSGLIGTMLTQIMRVYIYLHACKCI
jgi:hypothetical protein